MRSEPIVLDGIGLPFDGGLLVVTMSGALVALDAQGCALWEALQAGCSIDQIVNACSETGISNTSQAYTLVERILKVWQHAGIFDRDQRGMPSGAYHATGSLLRAGYEGIYQVGEQAVRLRCADRELGVLIDAAIHPFRVRTDAEASGLVEVSKDEGKFTVHCEAAVLANVGTPTDNRASARHRCLTALIEAASPSRRLLAIFHASAVACDDHCVLFVGPSGSGKSTLAASLVARGHRFVTDDYAPIEQGTGLVWPVPIAASIKSGSWRLLCDPFPELDRQPIFHHRGLRLRYLHFDEGSRMSLCVGLPIGAIVLPHYVSGEQIKVQRISATESLTAICAARSLLEISPEFLRETLELLERVPAYRLHFGDIDHVSAWLAELRSPA